MAMDAEPLSSIVQVNNYVQAASIAAASYNIGLIVGPTRIVQANGMPLTLQAYPSVSAMTQAGYGVNSPEVSAAGLYFDQVPTPSLVYIALQDATAIYSVTIDAPGTLYAAGDTGMIEQAGAQGGTYKVATVSAGGVPTAITLMNQGTGYAVGVGLATTTSGAGSGLTLNVTAAAQTAVQALQEARTAQPDWYGCAVLSATSADDLACLAWAQSASPDAFFFALASDTASVNSTQTSVQAQAFAAGYTNGLVTVSTTQQGIYPQNAYAQCAVMGMACGFNTGAPGSAFSLANKPIIGVQPEPLTFTQLSAIRNLNGNAVIFTNNNRLSLFTSGATPSGQTYDQVLVEKSLANQEQVALANYIISQPMVQQTDAAQNSLFRVVDGVLDSFVSIGWLAAGVYTGPTIGTLTSGTTLPKGYYVQSPSYAVQSAANRLAGMAQPVNTVALSSGSVQSIVINNYIQL